MNKIQGAIIGLGKMGLSHAAILGAHPDVELVAVCDILTQEECKTAYDGIPFYQSIDELLEKEKNASLRNKMRKR